MQEWTVGGAVIEGAVLGVESPAGMLLVENVRRNGSTDWTPPGGVIEADEPVVDGLAREVREETGLEVLTWVGPIYEIRAEAPQLGWALRVEVHRAVHVRGALSIGNDPDGIVVAADWVADGDCAERLATTHPWVREPLLAWMDERWVGSREFRYRVHGTGLDDHSIERC
jgi:8-oxo-dGTP diphosphatase